MNYTLNSDVRVNRVRLRATEYAGKTLTEEQLGPENIELFLRVGAISPAPVAAPATAPAAKNETEPVVPPPPPPPPAPPVEKPAEKAEKPAPAPPAKKGA